MRRQGCGDGEVTYTIERSGTLNAPATLPCGLAFIGSGRLRATASTATGKLHPADCSSRNTRYTLVATDVDGDRATLDFVLAVGSELTFGDVTGPTLTVRIGHLVEVELPGAEGGDGRVDYSLGATPALPDGLRFLRSRRGSNAKQSHTLWSTPTGAHPRTTYTLTTTGRDGDAATRNSTIQATTNRTPSFAASSTRARRFTVGQAVSDRLPGATGGDGSLTYTIDPALPHDLSLNGTTITGAATEARAETSDTLAASDADGDAATLTFRLAVASATAPKISDAAVTSTLSRGGDTYAMGNAITVRIDFDRPVAVGGSPRLGIGTATRYAMLSTRAPPGPGLRSASSATGTGGATASGGGAIAGTPTGEQAAATYTLRATDADGDETADDAATHTFTIEAARRAQVRSVEISPMWAEGGAPLRLWPEETRPDPRRSPRRYGRCPRSGRSARVLPCRGPRNRCRGDSKLPGSRTHRTRSSPPPVRCGNRPTART